MSRKVGSVVNYVVPHLTRCWQKFTGNNHGDQEVNFGPQNSLNLIYAHLQSKKFSGGYTPGPPLKGKCQVHGPLMKRLKQCLLNFRQPVPGNTLN
jgi:hypothetical protein